MENTNNKHVHQVVSLIVNETEVKLITLAGMIHLSDDSTYDTGRLVEEISPQLTGGNIVDVDLSNYLLISTALSTIQQMSGEGIRITHEIDGKMVHGIFYPENAKVEVQETPDAEPVAIPNVESLGKHIDRAAKEDSPAITNLLARIAPVARERGHSVEDFMRFIKKSEMPLTQDGRVITYKRVRNTNEEGVFVDCHTKSIKQKVGYRVQTDAINVDPSRYRSCSNGLHVANLGYMRGFHGDTVFLCLIDPKDFIAVPANEETKCRVCSYDIVGIVPKGASGDIEKSSTSADKEFQTLVKDIIEGRAIRPSTVVNIGKGSKIEYTRAITAEELYDPIIDSETPAPVVESSPESLDNDPDVDTSIPENDTSGTLKKLREDLGAKWSSAPENVIDCFNAIINKPEDKSLAALAKEQGTSTRTIGRWKDKYDFEGYKAAIAAEETKEDTPVSGEPEEGFDVVYYGPIKVRLIAMVRHFTKKSLVDSKNTVEGGGLILSNLNEKQKDELLNDVGEIGLVVIPHGGEVPERPVTEEKEPKKEAPKKKAPTKAKPTGSIAEQAKALMVAGLWEDLWAFKKAKKKSWSALGFSKTAEAKILKNKP